MKTLTETKNELKTLLPDGIDVLLTGIKAVIKEGTDKYNDLLLLEGRYKDANRQLLQGTLSDEAAQIQFNKIRKDLLEFIEGIEDNHLSASDGMGVDGKPDIHNGEILYRIPKQMQVEKEVKCLVRLAFDRRVIMEDIEILEGDVLKDIRIAEVMGVELIDMSGNTFEIRTLHDVVQFVEKDLFTEWVFYVKPLLSGEQNLVLKISIIEIKNGVERKRNVVLEEKVEIIATVPKESGVKEEFQKAGIGVAVAHQQSGGGASPAPSPSPSGPIRGAKGAGMKKLMTAMTAMLALVVASVAMWNYLGPGGGNAGPPAIVTADDRDWDNLKNNPTNEGVRDFINKYPESDFRNNARLVLDSLAADAYETALASLDPKQMRQYMDDYPNGQHFEDAAGMIVAWENEPPTNNEGENEPPRTVAPDREIIKTTPPGKVVKPTDKGDTNIAGNTPPTTTTTPPTVDPNAPISMRSAARLPIYPRCKKDDKSKEEACTKRQIGRHITNNLKYPQKALDKEIEGLVNVEFIVEKDGRITEVQYKNDIGGGCAIEAVRLVQKLPNFKPGLNNKGEPVRILYKLPIRFQLND